MEQPKKGKEHTRRVPRSLKLKAKALYFDYRSINTIKEETGISASTIHHWVHGYRQRADRQDMPVERTWKYQRDKTEEQMVQELSDANKRELHRIYRASLPLIADSLESLKNSTLDLKDTALVAEIITKVDKLFRLSVEKPTEILGISNLSLQDMKNAIEGDFFRRTPRQVKELIDGESANVLSGAAGPSLAETSDPFPEVSGSGDQYGHSEQALSALVGDGENGAGDERPGEASTVPGAG